MMEHLAQIAEKIIDALLRDAGPSTIVVFLVACLFAYMYFREKIRNNELTDVILMHSERHANKFVDVVTDGIEAEHKLAITMSQLASSITDIKHRLDTLVDLVRPDRR